MTRLLFILLLALQASVLAQTAPAAKSPPATPAKDDHKAEDIARHRQMARAHEEAARCLEAGMPEKQCHEKLREACKGIGVGQYCGMRHAH